MLSEVIQQIEGEGLTVIPADQAREYIAKNGTGEIIPAKLGNFLGQSQAESWPDSLGEAAYWGLTGDLVRMIEPHTEADPTAILVQFLVMFGNVIGRNAYFSVEADRHHLNLFAVVVGTTSKGRKGTSLGQAKKIIGSADTNWLEKNFNSGLSSGEGLIHAVRDAVEKEVKDRENSTDDFTAFKMETVDPGVEDKRLIVIESEFASVLKVAAREGNTLTSIIRQAWDDGNLSSMTKNCPTRATAAHISIIGHITKDEILRCLDQTETANGFANRYLWVVSKRSKLLPEGGRLNGVDFSDLEERLKRAVVVASKTSELKRDEEARQLWIRVYPELSEGKLGMLGAITSRGEAQVMRLACLYALLDCSPEIRKEHLEAALEIWRYCEDSARFIFGDKLGDPVADQILYAIRGSGEFGMTSTEISALFGRHKSAVTIHRALNTLSDAGLIISQKESTQGRSIERWFANAQPAKEAKKAKEVLSQDEGLIREKSELSEERPQTQSRVRLNSHNSLNSQLKRPDEEEF